MWTRNFGFPTEWSASIGTNRAIVTMAATEPMKPAMYRVTLNGVHFGDFPSATLAKDALETSLAPSLMIVPAAAVPDPPRAQLSSEASTTIGAALLSGRPDVQVTKETIASERQWSKYQRAVFDFVREGTGNAIIEAVAGSGKCLEKGTPVMLHNGRIVPVESVKVGDRLMGPDSEPREVLSTNIGHGPLWRITPVKGESWVCNDVHVMTLAGTNRHFGEVIDIPLNEHIAKNSRRGRVDRDWKLMRVGVTFPPCDVPVDPYLVGLWIGDGSTGKPSITNGEPEIRDYCRRIAPLYGAELVEREDAKHNTWDLRFRIAECDREAGRHVNVLSRFFCNDCSRDGAKVIPDCYLYNDEATRLAILAGIVDTDGFIFKGTIEVTTVSPVLRDQYLYLARSLGLAAYTSEKIATIKSIGFTGLYQRVTISGDIDRIPCLVARRQAPERRQIKRVSVTGFDAEPIGEGDYYGFTLDRDGRFLLGDFTVTHNSTTITEALRYIPADKSVLLLAFNKEAKKDLLVKVPKRQGLAVRTLVAQGYTFLREHWRAEYVSDPLAEMRDDTVIREAFGDDQIMFGEKEGKKFWKEFTDLVGLCQSYLASTDAEITFIQNDHGVLVDKRTESAEAWRAPAGDDRFWGHRDVLRWTKAALANQLREPRRKTKTKDGDIPFISFRDMVYVPAMNPDWVPPQLFDFVFVDETQDCDVAQLSLVMRSVKPGGRIIVVGDRRQSIYRWRGADAEAMPRMQKTLNATMLPLYDSYRVTQCSAEEARRVVPHFDTPRDEHGNSLAMPGICKEISAFEMLSMWNVGDTVISRQNKVMIPLAMKALRDRKIPYIMGDEDQIPKALKSALSKIIKSMGGNQSIDAFREALIRWADAEREAVTKSVIDRRRDWERRMSKKWRGELDEGADEELNYVKVGTIEDAFWNQDGTGLSQMPGIKNANDLYAFIKEIAPTKSESSREKKELTPEQFKAMLAQRILITSVHRIKGGEGRRIFILEDTFKYNRGGLVTKQRLRPKEVTEEQNLWYVAVTRVKYERGNPARGIPPRDGELYYVYGLEDLIGKFSMDDKDDE